MALEERPPAGFLAMLEPAELATLQARARRRRHRAGTAILHEHTVSDSVLVVISGRVKVSTLTGDGKEVVLSFRGPGDLLGELSAIDGHPRSATVSAMEPVEVMLVASTDFRAFLKAHPRVALLIMEMIGERLRDADRLRIEYAANDTVGRVAGRLLELGQEHGRAGGSGLQITLPISQEELAGWTGSSREAVAKALHTLRELGYVATERRSITLLDLEGLRRRSL